MAVKIARDLKLMFKNIPNNNLQHYKYIDALRGLAFLLVLLVHTDQQVGEYTGKILALSGKYGVQLFFVISSLTLFLSLNQRKKFERRFVLNFFIRRLFRIAPLFWFGIIIYTLVNGTGPRYSAPDGINLWNFIKN